MDFETADFNSCCVLQYPKGVLPWNISYKRIPKAQTSVLAPYILSIIPYGLMHNGLPILTSLNDSLYEMKSTLPV